MDSHSIEAYFRQHQRTLGVLFLIVAMVSVSGLFMGMRQTEAQTAPREWEVEEEAELDGEVPLAPRYGEIENAPWLANRDWSFTLADLPQVAPDYEPQQALGPKALAAALTARAERRAFDGAPPTVPHQIDQLDSAACIVCHATDETLSIGDVRPATISHPYFANCTQCHVPSDGLRRLTEQELLVVESSFVGAGPSGPGTRAYPEAPPTVPHPLWMRQNCMSCHGPAREHAIKTSHPARQNCLQCHALDSAFDNREQVPNSPPSNEP